MLYLRFVFYVVLLGMSWSANSQCTITDFENLPNLGGMLDITDGGFNFNDPFIIDGWLWNSPCPIERTFSELGSSMVGPSGYIASSGDFGYLNGFAAYPIDIQFQGGCSSFITLQSLFINAAWEDGLVITIDGLNAGSVVANSGNITLDSSTPPSLVSLNFVNIDAIQIQLVSVGINNPNFAGVGQHLAIDDFTFCCGDDCTARPVILLPNSETIRND